MSIHEECGVFGVISPKPVDVANISYYGYTPATQGTRKLWNRCER